MELRDNVRHGGPEQITSISQKGPEIVTDIRQPSQSSKLG
jgi:hypothetical protein